MLFRPEEKYVGTKRENLILVHWLSSVISSGLGWVTPLVGDTKMTAGGLSHIKTRKAHHGEMALPHLEGCLCIVGVVNQGPHRVTPTLVTPLHWLPKLQATASVLLHRHDSAGL